MPRTLPLMPTSKDKPITKSQFKLGLDCIQKLRHARNGLPQTSEENEMLRLLSEGGAAIEALVRANHPGDSIGDFGQDAIDKSRRAIATALADADAGTSTSLYEVTIEHDGFLARIDLLRIHPGRIELVEIKSKSADTSGTGTVSDGEFLTDKGRPRANWLPYLQDLAFQRELMHRWLGANGYATRASRRDHVNPRLLLVKKDGAATKGTVLDPSNFQSRYETGSRGIRAAVSYVGTAQDPDLLVEVDMERVVSTVDNAAGSTVPEFLDRGIDGCMAAMKAIVDTNRWPDPRIALGTGCKKCEFRVRPGLPSGFDACWGTGTTCGAGHVLTLTYISDKQCEAALEASGPSAEVLDLDDADFTPRQFMQVSCLRAGKPIVTASFAADPMEALKVKSVTEPIWFLDFETSAYPVPSRIGGRPFEHVPFQFEGHQLPSATSGVEARIRLRGFLDLTSADPRRQFIDALMEQFPGGGPIFHWHHFEQTVLNGIKTVLQSAPASGDTERIAFIDRLVGPSGKGGGRLIDLLPIAKAAFCHPDMAGSYSIKKVVPIAWATEDIRRHFVAGHGAAGDPDFYSGDTDPYDGLPAPPQSILEAVGGIEAAKDLAQADDGEGSAVRNGGMAMLAYHYVRMFPGHASNPEIVAQFRQYCRLDSAAMVMVYALMRDHVGRWSRTTAA